jgi:hypothetical protein
MKAGGDLRVAARLDCIDVSARQSASATGMSHICPPWNASTR